MNKKWFHIALEVFHVEVGIYLFSVLYILKLMGLYYPDFLKIVPLSVTVNSNKKVYTHEVREPQNKNPLNQLMFTSQYCLEILG